MSRRTAGAFFLILLGMVPAPRCQPESSSGARDAAPWVASEEWVGRGVPGAPKREWQKHKSGRVAMISSFAFPGLGQLYNEREFWAAVVAGIEFYFIGNCVSEQRLANRYRAIVDQSPGDQEARVLFELHRDNRIQSTWLLGLTIILSGIQSYVDASLADFDKSPLPLRLAPSFTGGPSAGLQLRF